MQLRGNIMNKQDRNVVRYPKEREDRITAIGIKLDETAKSLSPDERDSLAMCIKAFKIICPVPRVCKVIANFLNEMTDEQYKQDKIYGTDSDNPDQMVVRVVRKNKNEPGNN